MLLSTLPICRDSVLSSMAGSGGDKKDEDRVYSSSTGCSSRDETFSTLPCFDKLKRYFLTLEALLMSIC